MFSLICHVVTPTHGGSIHSLIRKSEFHAPRLCLTLRSDRCMARILPRYAARHKKNYLRLVTRTAKLIDRQAVQHGIASLLFIEICNVSILK